MNGYTLSTTLDQPYAAAVTAVRDALGEQGFGILTEIDPDAMMGLADNEALHTVAADAKQRLTAALAALAGKG